MNIATPLQRQSLHDQIVERLRVEIIEGHLAPGAKLNEKALCERFGVSRTPLRESLKVLAAEGLVQITPHYGASITPLTIEDLEEVFPIMGALEGVSGELAAQRMTDAEIAGVARDHNLMLRHYEAREMPEYFECNERIHAAILDGARNPTLIATMRGLAGRVRRARYQANMSEERWRKAVEEHEVILSALQSRDAAALSDILRIHLLNKLETVRESLR